MIQDHAIERSRQLSSCFRRALSTPADRAVVLGGDLNLRDTELAQVGGISEGLSDLWEETGARPECRYTWDMTRNTNLEVCRPGSLVERWKRYRVGWFFFFFFFWVPQKCDSG